jgi:TrmH family RNA methyltransferase
MKTIASRQNPIVRTFRDLADRPDPQGARLLLDGAHLVREALDAGLAFEHVCVAASLLDRHGEEAALTATLEGRGIAVTAAPDKLIAAVSPVRTPSGIVAIATRRQHAPRIDDIVAASDAMLLVGVDIQDPGNVGALLRVAEAAGAGAVVLAGDSANPFSWKALRGSMGSALRLPVVNGVSPDGVLDSLGRHQVRTVAAVARGGVAPDHVRWTSRVAIVVGGEGPGLSDAIVAQCDERVTIPMARPVESLNVTVAAAILLYSARSGGAGRQPRREP